MRRKTILKDASVLLIASLMVLSTIVVTANTTKLTTNLQPPSRLTGLAPKVAKTGENQPHALFTGKGYFYAYDAYPGAYICYFNTNAIISNLCNPGISSFFSGSDMDSNGNWYAVCYDGGLYQIDPNTGSLSYISPTPPLNSLVYDSMDSTWYACGGWRSPDTLYNIDMATGATTVIGPFNAPNTMISLMCDTASNLYGYDVLFGGNSTLYHIDKTTGLATPLHSMGHDFCYAQEGKFDRNTGILYLAAYDIGLGQSYLATCDPSSGAVYILNLFSPMDDIDALAIPWPQPVPDLIIYDLSNGLPVQQIKDNTYEPPNWPPASPAMTQTGRWLIHFWTIYFYIIQLQNDGTVPLSSYTISTTLISVMGGTITTGSRWYYAGPHPIGGSYSTTSGPSIGPAKWVFVYIRTSSSSTTFKVGINVISSSGGQDSVIITS